MSWEDDNRRLRQLEQEAREWERDSRPIEDGPFPKYAGELDQHNRLIEIRQLRQKVHGGS